MLILGCNGMLGHKCYQVLSPMYDTTGTISGDAGNLKKYGFFKDSTIISSVNAFNISTIEKVVAQADPDIIINCIGIVKSRKEPEFKKNCIWINSLFPHQLYQISKRRGIRLIHISTDCVFSGRSGNYREDDIPDAEDIYGRTKYLGEVSSEGALTIRTSFIGRELYTSNGLIEWFLSNRGGNINGYTNAIFSGFPSIHIAGIISDLIKNHPTLSGVYHLSSDPISKFALLTSLKKELGLDIQINEFPDFYCNRSLDSSLFRQETGFKPDTWEKMMEEFAVDAIQYQEWRE